MLELPKKEVIDDIYKPNKPNKPILKKPNELVGNKKENDLDEEEEENKKKESEQDKNNELNTSKLNESHMKRRPGIYSICPISKKQEQKDSKKDANKEQEEKKEEDKIEQISPFLQKILDFESSFTGIILIIIIGTISLLLYDLKHAAIPGKYDIVSIIIMFLLSLYHVFDLIFRNIYFEKSVGSSYFKLQVFSVISLIFDFNLAIFLLLRFIFNKTINKRNKYLSSNNLQLIMYILNCLQVFKVLRFIKIYLMINKLFKEIEKKKKFEEVVEELKKKSQKGKILNMPLPMRLSKVKTNINNNLANNINPNGNNGNNPPPAPKNDNGNVSYITTNSILNAPNPNEADNNKTNNIIKQDNNNNISEIAFPNVNKTSNNIKDKDNASILPLNLNMASPKKLNKKYLKSKSIAFKNKNDPSLDKDKTNKLMEKINEKFQQTRNATRLNNGISQLLIILLLLIFFMYTLTYGDFIYKREEEYKIISNYINILSNMCKQVYAQNDAHNSNFKCNELLSEKINALMNQISIKHFSIIQVEYNYEIIYRKTTLSNETKDYYPGEYNYIYSKYDNLTSILILQKFYFRLYAILNILKLLFILTSLYIICLRLNKDLNLLILKPLNDINKVIDKVSKDPVNNKIISELKQNFENRIDNIIQRDKKNVKYEMKVIESTLIRTSGLISVGYGEAGSTIIKQFIKGNEGFDPMSSGNIIEAIFGFCFIHDFAEISEVFEEKTMIFVNHICDIVHSCVDKFNGYTNKNIGDCFLLAWKIKNPENKPSTKPASNKNLFNQNQNEELTELADCALLAFLNIFKKINKTRKILAYRKDPDIIKRFGTRYSIGLGFGLHYGWGIEGAIGSHHKIDCSYLSPNVNIAARLETATNIYGVDILFSGEFYELLSDFMKEKCRKIDVVTLKGSEKPVNLYTVDLNKNIKPGKLTSNKDRMSVREKMDYYGQKKRKLWKKYENSKKNKTIGEIYYKESKGFRQILNNQKSSLFYNNFEEGLSHYIDGEWEEAAAFLYRALYLDNSDGPTKTILEYMKKLKYKAPDDWDGYRVLTSKT